MSKFLLCNYVKPIFIKTNEISCNCSTFVRNNKRYLISRNVTYFLSGATGTLLNNCYHTNNFLYDFTDVNKPVFIKELNSLTESNNCRYFGLEDIRTIDWNGTTYISCTKVLGNTDTATMCFGQLNDKFELVNLQEHKTACRREKNWVPVETKHFTYVYAFEPLKFFNLHDKCFVNGEKTFKMKVSGSTPVIKYNDYLLTLVHTKNSTCDYEHRFAVLTNDFKLVKLSEPFQFFGNKTEFCCDLKYVNGNIQLIAAVNDGLSYYFEFSDDVLLQILEDKLTDNTQHSNIYNTFLKNSVEIKAAEFAPMQALYADDKELIAQAIILNHDKSRLDMIQRVRLQAQLLKKLH